MGDHDNRRCEFEDPKPCSLSFPLIPCGKAREMADALKQYSSLSSSSGSSEVNAALGKIINSKQLPPASQSIPSSYTYPQLGQKFSITELGYPSSSFCSRISIPVPRISSPTV